MAGSELWTGDYHLSMRSYVHHTSICNLLDLRVDYRQILTNAYQRGGYADPSSYLKSLSQEELATIQQVHHLADPISTGSLSSEAALPQRWQ